jgi:peroxiredoxin
VNDALDNAPTKLAAGDDFPRITVPKLGGGTLELGVPKGDADWQMVVVYRGQHCPLCTKYLTQLKELGPQFIGEGVDVVVVSADTEEKARAHAGEKLQLPFEVGYDLSIEQMQQLGLYISHPRSPKETDRPFAEPGLFVVNGEHRLHVVDLSNNPFVRPELSQLLSGLKWIRNPENNYPIRGTYR